MANVMKKIPKKKSRSGVDEYGRNDLHYAALKNDLARVRQLIASGIDVNALDNDGFLSVAFCGSRKPQRHGENTIGLWRDC